MKKKPKISADGLLDTLLETAEALVRTLHEEVRQAEQTKAELRSIKEWTGAAKELTSLVKSLGERETRQTEQVNRITVRFMDAEDYTN